MRQFYINGVASSQFAIYCTSDTFLNSPEYAYEAYDVPSVNGALLKYDKHLNNVIRRFDCYCKDYPQNNLDAFKKMLYSNSGYMRIESDYDPDTYQMGYLTEGIEFEPFDADGNFTVHFSVTFSCKPQKWYKQNSAIIGSGSGSRGLENIMPRNTEFIQTLFNKLPINDIPNGDFFFLTSTVDPATTSHITGTSQAGLPLYYVGANETSTRFTARYLLAYSDVGELDDDITYTTPTPTSFVFVSPIGETEVSWTIDPNRVGQISTDSTYYDSGFVESTNRNAIGCNPDVRLEIQVNNLNPQGIYYARVYGKSDGAVAWDSVIKLDFSLLRNWSELVARYAHNVDGYGNFLYVAYDHETMGFYFEDINGNRRSIDECVQLSGDIGGNCDTVKVESYPIVNNAYALDMRIVPNWWTV